MLGSGGRRGARKRVLRICCPLPLYDASLNQDGGCEKRERSLPVIKYAETHGLVYLPFSKYGCRTFAASLTPFQGALKVNFFFISRLKFF